MRRIATLSGLAAASIALLAASALPAQAAEHTPRTAPTAAATQAAGSVNILGTTPEITVHGSADFKDALVNGIKSIDTDDRGSFVQQAIDKAFNAGGARYNVMMMNLSQGYEDRLSGVAAYANIKFGKVYYGMWLFDKGTFRNTGDGGWINWGFKGSFTRDGGNVTFY